MNHAKLETYRFFDASIVPVCTGGLRVPDSGFRAAFAAKSGGHTARQLDGGVLASRPVPLLLAGDAAIQEAQGLRLRQ